MSEPPEPPTPGSGAGPRVIQIKPSQAGRTKKQIQAAAKKKEEEAVARLEEKKKKKAEGASAGIPPPKNTNPGLAAAQAANAQRKAEPLAAQAAAKAGPSNDVNEDDEQEDDEELEDDLSDELVADLGADDDDDHDAADLPPPRRATEAPRAEPPIPDHDKAHAQRLHMASAGKALDPELERRNDLIEQKKQAIRDGKTVRPFRGKLSAKDDYNAVSEVLRHTGRLKLSLVRSAPSHHEYLQVDVRHIPTHNDLLSFVQIYLWDGQASKWDYEVSNSGRWGCKGDITLAYSQERVDIYTRQVQSKTLPRWPHWEGVPSPVVTDGSLDHILAAQANGSQQPGQPANGQPMTNGQPEAAFCPHCGFGPRAAGTVFCARCGKNAGPLPSAQPAAAAPQVQMPVAGGNDQLVALLQQMVNQTTGTQSAQIQQLTNAVNALAAKNGVPQVQTPQAAAALPQPPGVDGVPPGAQLGYWQPNSPEFWPADWTRVPLPKGAIKGYYHNGTYGTIGTPQAAAAAAAAVPTPTSAAAATATTPQAPGVDGVPPGAQLGYWQPGSEDFWPADWTRVPLPKGATKGYYHNGIYGTIGAPHALPAAPAAGAGAGGAAAPTGPETLEQQLDKAVTLHSSIKSAGEKLGIITPANTAPAAGDDKSFIDKDGDDTRDVAKLGPIRVPRKNGEADTDASAGLIAAMNIDVGIGLLDSVVDKIFGKVEKLGESKIKQAAAATQIAEAMERMNRAERERQQLAANAQQNQLGPAPRVAPQSAPADQPIGVREKAPPNGQNGPNGHNGNGQNGHNRAAGGPAQEQEIASADEFDDEALERAIND